MLRSQCDKGSPYLHLHASAILGALLAASVAAAAQKPVAELPRVYLNTTYALPTGGQTWAAHTSADLTNALAKSQAGDVIVLDAGTTYTGNFQVPAKFNPNHKWIYVISSKLANLPQGKRVSPSDAVNMPTIVSPNVLPAIDIRIGADHWRFAGVNMTETYVGSNEVFGTNTQAYTPTTQLPDSITVDRCYIHGLPTATVHRDITANISNFAIIESYVSDAQGPGSEVQGILVWQSPGPFKIVNNYISGATENILFGGAGGGAYQQPYVPSDIEIRNNYLYKPLSWLPHDGQPALGVAKNAFEVKNGRRILFDGNTIENMWAGAQVGFAVVLTVRTSDSGDVAVVDDINVTNNILKNVVSGFNILYKDDGCKLPVCHNAGEANRINISNNLITHYDPNAVGGSRNVALQFAGGMDRINGNVRGVPQNTVYQHNTQIANPAIRQQGQPWPPCWQSVLFADNGVTNNVWILDNAFCNQVPMPGQASLVQVMGSPSTPPYDLTQRYYGNVMYVPAGDKVQTFPPHNLATTKAIRLVDPVAGNHDLSQPEWTETSNGKLAGVDSSSLPRE